MITKIPDEVIHGLRIRLSQRCTDEACDKMLSQLSGEHDMAKALTFILPGYQGFEFHIMIRRVVLEPKSEIVGLVVPPVTRWQTIILFVTKQAGFLFDEPPPAPATTTAP